MLLELTDQRDPDRLLYRCVNCAAEGISSPAFATDGYFFDGTERPGKWVKHICGQAVPLPAKAAKRAKAAAS